MEQISGMEHISASRLTYSCLAEDGGCKYVMDFYLTHTVIYCSPEAVNVSNMAALIDAEGKPHFKYIVEGANLFLTQQARLHLEKRKVVLFKDSSANKGKSINSVHIVLAELFPRWCDEFITRSPRGSSALHSRIRGPHDLQRRQTL
jgi:hypothetical protein